MDKDINQNESHYFDFEEYNRLLQKYLIDKIPEKIESPTDKQIETNRIQVEKEFKERREYFIKRLEQLGINSLDENGVAKTFYEVFQELRDKWFGSIEYNYDKINNNKKSKCHKQKFFE